MYDLIIRNGHVVDWLNGVDTVTDLAVDQGRIACVGTCGESARRTVDASGLLVVPGIIDSHMHASSWLGGPMSYRMLAMAGVTTALEMAGPLESVKSYMRDGGCGLTIGCLEQVRPGLNIASDSPDLAEIDRVTDEALDRGAFGMKLLGGHYPLTPGASRSLLARCAERTVYFAVHAGSTEKGSNIEGMREIIELAAGTPFHLCHINAYCRGARKDLESEISEAAALLNDHPEIDTESYLSPINGCSGKCVNGAVESGVTRNCLKSKGYATDLEGMRRAIAEGFAQVHQISDGVVKLAGRAEGLALWEQKQSDVPVSFQVNPGLSRYYFATARRRGSQAFLVDSFCTDGGGIPRNVIIANGLSLVRFGSLTLSEFVLKSSYAAAQLLGLPEKGHFTVGADADITLIDMNAQQATHSFVQGAPVLERGQILASGGTLLTTPRGVKAAHDAGLKARAVDMTELFNYRANRFSGRTNK